MWTMRSCWPSAMPDTESVLENFLICALNTSLLHKPIRHLQFHSLRSFQALNYPNLSLSLGYTLQSISPSPCADAPTVNRGLNHNAGSSAPKRASRIPSRLFIYSYSRRLTRCQTSHRFCRLLFTVAQDEDISPLRQVATIRSASRTGGTAG